MLHPQFQAPAVIHNFQAWEFVLLSPPGFQIGATAGFSDRCKCTIDQALQFGQREAFFLLAGGNINFATKRTQFYKLKGRFFRCRLVFSVGSFDI